MKSLPLNEGLKELDAYAFAGNDNLKELAIPKSVKKIRKHKILEEVQMISEYGYKNKTYIVYKNSYAHGWVKRNGLKYRIAEVK